MQNSVIHGTCQEVLSQIEDNTFDLIITSPPYADARKHDYGGVDPDKYLDWMLPKTQDFLRVLKPTGTFILNIKERVVNGERHTYVLELILALRKQGWLWTEEFMWHKKNSVPGKWPNRFRDSWERLLQFNKAKNFNMYQDEVKIPIGNWSKARLTNLSDKDMIRDESSVNSGFGKNISNWVGKETVYPTNVLHMATECGNKNHSAAFPEELPTWFIKLFTKEGDYVLDPFVGSGTSCLAAKKLKRNYLGIDILENNITISKERIAQCQLNTNTSTS
jgi:site-specific DNA-methyltransferase (adenine-specific)